MLTTEKPQYAAGMWTKHVVDHHPPTAAVVGELKTSLKADQPPDAATMFNRALTLSRQQLKGHAFGSEEERASTEMATALISLGHIALYDGDVRMFMGPFLPTGRPGSFDVDACWHMTSQCRFAFLCEHDRKFGDGTMRDAFFSLAAALDHEGRASSVRRAYEESRGALRPLHPDGYAGYYDVDFEGFFFAAPDGLSDDEKAAWDQAVRCGDAYEHSSSTDRTYAPDELRTSAEPIHPYNRVVPTHTSFSGLTDPGVCVDITANRIGAWLGIQLARDPSNVPEIPLDTAATRALRPLTPPKTVSFARYYAVESVALAKTGLLDGGAANESLAAHEAHAASVGPEEAMKELRRKLFVVVDNLFATDRKKLGQLYATFAVRHLGWRVPIGPGGLSSPDYDGHERYGAHITPGVMRTELEYRLKAMEKVFTVSR